MVAPVRVRFIPVKVKPFGPVQLYVAFVILLAVKLMGSPAQTELSPEIVGEEGIAFTCVAMLLLLITVGAPEQSGVRTTVTT